MDVTMNFRWSAMDSIVSDDEEGEEAAAILTIHIIREKLLANWIGQSINISERHCVIAAKSLAKKAQTKF